MKDRTIRIHLAYDGSAYNGWQIQPDVPTVQGELERAFSRIFKQPIRVIGAGRTDAKAHGLNYTAHFRTNNLSMPVNRIPIAVNSLLSDDIRVQTADEMSAYFHACFSALAREYVYVIQESNHPLPHLRNYAYFYNRQPDLDLLRKATKVFEGEHDFKSFCYGYPDLEERNTVRQVYYFRVARLKDFLIFFIKGSGFLQGMIRSIISACLNYAEHKVSLGDIQGALDRKILLENRYRVAVPARGLYFKRAYYPSNFIQKR